MSRILILNHYAGIPGIGRGLRHHQFASEWRKQGVNVCIACSNNHHLLFNSVEDQSGRHQVDGIDFFLVNTPTYSGNGIRRIINMMSFAWKTAFTHSAELLKGKPDVIIASSPHPFSWLAAARLASKAGCPLVIEVRDLWPESLVELLGLSRFHPLVLLLSKIEKWAYRRADLVVSNLPFADRYMNEIDAAPEKFAWVANGFGLSEPEESRIPPGHQHLFQQLNEEGKRIVVYAGAHGIPNALEEVIDAAYSLQQRGEHSIALVFIGDGDQKEKLIEKASSIGLCNVHFLGSIDRPALLALLRRGHIGLATVRDSRLYRYGLSLNKLFEYMGAGLPVIYSANSDYNPVAEAECGVTVPAQNGTALADAMLGLVSLSDAELNAMAARGRAHISDNYSYSSLAEKYLNEMEAIVEA